MMDVNIVHNFIGKIYLGMAIDCESFQNSRNVSCRLLLTAV